MAVPLKMGEPEKSTSQMDGDMIESEKREGRVIVMRKVRCHECGKIYNFDVDDFCPRCGAFTQPPKSIAIDANGSVVRVDGINEKNHAGSFVHEELHEENRERKRMGLSRSTRRTAARPSSYQAAQSQQAQGSGRAKPAGFRWIFYVVAVIIALNILSAVLEYLYYWI